MVCWLICLLNSLFLNFIHHSVHRFQSSNFVCCIFDCVIENHYLLGLVSWRAHVFSIGILNIFCILFVYYCFLKYFIDQSSKKSLIVSQLQPIATAIRQINTVESPNQQNQIPPVIWFDLTAPFFLVVTVKLPSTFPYKTHRHSHIQTHPFFGHSPFFQSFSIITHHIVALQQKPKKNDQFAGLILKFEF